MNNIIEGYKEDIVKSTCELVSIKSVETEPEEWKPFGTGVNDALQYYLDLAQKMGFETKNVDGYAGHVEYGDGEDIIGVLVHLDVVPEGDGWTHPPYGGEIHDNRIYGRGTIDNKGPAIASLYGLKAIKDMGIKLNKKIRIIAGLDEESGWECMKHYFESEEKPVCGFSPDAEFPIINSEMGILIFKMRMPFKESGKSGVAVKSIEGGNRPNMVPDYCEAVLEVVDVSAAAEIVRVLASFTEETGYDINMEKEGNKIILKSLGVSAHGSTPEKGKNAITQLIMFLNVLDLGEGDVAQYIGTLVRKIGTELDGKSLGIDFEDKVSGKLVFNLGQIKVNDTEGEVVINIRYPISYTADRIVSKLDKALDDTGVEVIDVSDNSPLYVDEDNFLIQKLMKVYEEEMGQEARLLSIGGGTYARAIDNAVAFGPLFPGQPELAHQKDEYIDIDHLIKITKIYQKAMCELAK